MPDILNWWDLLEPASYNGIPFFVADTQRGGGRQKVVTSYYGRDDPFIEDTGALPKKFSVTCYVAGDDFIALRDELLDALEGSPTSGTLVLPNYGHVTAAPGEVSVRESKERGSYSEISVEFTQDVGAQPSPLISVDTASVLLDCINSLGSFIEAAFAIAIGISATENSVNAQLNRQLTLAQTAFGVLPQATLAGITPGFTASVSDPTDTAQAVIAAFAAAAANVVGAQPVPSMGNAVTGVIPQQATPSDPSGGLLALASWGDLTVPPIALPILGVAQAALVTLVQGAALMAVVSVYAQLDWQSTQAAAAALDALMDLFDAQVAAAADAGNFDLFRAWRAIEAATIADMRDRAQSLPTLASFAFPSALPALVVAQQLLQDATQADELVRLNDTPHPLFMAPAGFWLQPA